MKRAILIIALFAIALGVNGCKKEGVKEGEKPAAEKEAKATETKAGRASIGVPECDDYINKYEKCVTENVPEAARDSLKSALDQSYDAWKQSASTPQGKSALASGCKAALDAAKQSMGAYGCEW